MLVWIMLLSLQDIVLHQAPMHLYASLFIPPPPPPPHDIIHLPTPQYFNALKGNQESGTVVSFAALAIISRIITVITSITLYTEFGACAGAPPPPPPPPPL